MKEAEHENVLSGPKVVEIDSYRKDEFYRGVDHLSIARRKAAELTFNQVFAAIRKLSRSFNMQQKA